MRLLGVPTRVCFRPSSSSLLAAPQPRARPPKQRKLPESARELKSSQAIIRSYVPALIYRVPIPNHSKPSVGAHPTDSVFARLPIVLSVCERQGGARGGQGGGGAVQWRR